MNKVKVIYILGHGRSGSTLLDLLLATQKNILSIGQFVGFKKLLLPSNQTCCTCGKKNNECEVWGKIIDVQKKFFYNNGVFENNDYFAQGQRVKQLVRAVLFFINGSASNKKEVYIKHQSTLLQSICHRGGGEYLVDSSKNINRYLALIANKEIELVTVFLVRDMIGVSRSKNKNKSERRSGTIISSFSWAYQNLISLLVFKKYKGSKVFVQYSEIVANPDDVIDKIFSQTNIEISVTKTNGSFNTSEIHMLTGNSIREEKEITIKMKSKNSSSDLNLLEKILDLIIGKPVLKLVNSFGKNQ